MKKRAIVCLVMAIAFATYTVNSATMALATPKAAVVEVKTGTLTGQVTSMEEKALAGVSIKILDAMGKLKHSATTDTNGKYEIAGLAAGTYTLTIADSQKVSLVVKSDANNTILNAMLPSTTKAYAAGDIAGLSDPLIVAIAGGVVLIGVAAFGISQYDSDSHERVSP